MKKMNDINKDIITIIIWVIDKLVRIFHYFLNRNINIIMELSYNWNSKDLWNNEDSMNPKWFNKKQH